MRLAVLFVAHFVCVSALAPGSCGLRRRGLVLRARIQVTEADDGFVDETNLEDGEVCVVALKAFDAFDTCLGAGALVATERGYDVWLADSEEDGIGQNIQVPAMERLAVKLRLRV